MWTQVIHITKKQQKHAQTFVYLLYSMYTNPDRDMQTHTNRQADTHTHTHSHTHAHAHLSLQFPYPAEYDDWLLEWPPGRGQGLVLWLPPLPLLSFFLPQNESKRLVTLLWVCEGNELHLVTDWTGHLKPGLLAVKGPVIVGPISGRGVKGWPLFWKLKGRPDGNMSASVLSISSQDAYQASISTAGEKGQTVAVNPYSAAGKL